MSSSGEEKRFANDAARVAGACFGGLIAIIGLAGLTQRDWFALVYVLGGVAFALKALRSATVVVTLPTWSCGASFGRAATVSKICLRLRWRSAGPASTGLVGGTSWCTSETE